jgi:hypothetical protein
MTSTVILAATAVYVTAQMKLEACALYVQKYAHEGASVEQMQKYSECISLLHPENLSPNTLLALKAAVLFIILCSLAGAVLGFRSDDYRQERIAGSLLFGVLAFCASAAAVLAFTALWFVVIFLFS